MPGAEDTDRGDNVPFLELDLRVVRARLSPDELLEVADGVVGTALHAHCGHRARPSANGA